MTEIAWLDDGETLTYLHATVSTHAHPVAVPETPFHLDALLADEPLSGGLAPMLGDAHLRVPVGAGFPDHDLARTARRSQSAGLRLSLDDALSVHEQGRRRDANSSACAGSGSPSAKGSWRCCAKPSSSTKARWSIPMPPTSRPTPTRRCRSWAATRSPSATSPPPSPCMDADPTAAEQKLRAVERTIQGRGFVTIAETLNSVEAWLSSLPGHVYANVRQPIVSTLNLAHLMPLSAVWAGPGSQRASRRAAADRHPHRRRDAVPPGHPRRRRRPHAGGRARPASASRCCWPRWCCSFVATRTRACSSSTRAIRRAPRSWA